MKLPTLKQCEKAIGEPAKQWAGRCAEIASKLVSVGAVKGTSIYGHYTGTVHLNSYFGSRARVGFIRHGWVLLPDKRVFDPTRWAFDAKKPYIYIGVATDYDEGGSRIRRVLAGPPPCYDPYEVQHEISSTLLASAPWCHVEKLLNIDVTEQEPGTLCQSQLFWLANASVEILQPHVVAIYTMLISLRRSALIPIDNVHMVERLTDWRIHG